MNNLENMSLAQLKVFAKEMGLKNISTLRKQELVNLISEQAKSVQEPKQEQKQKKKENRGTQILPKRQ